MEIVLIRHGQPNQTKNEWLNANEFSRWLNEYNLSEIAQESLPPTLLMNQGNRIL